MLSSLTAAAARAAEQVAEAPDPLAEAPVAEAAARQQLGSFGATRIGLDWLEVDGQEVVLEVRGDSPTFLSLPAGWSAMSARVHRKGGDDRLFGVVHRLVR